MRAGSTTSRGAVALAIDVGPLGVFYLQRAGIQPAQSDQGRPSSSTWLLIGVEFRELSMDEDRIPLVKAVVRGSSVEEAQAFVAEARTLEDASEVTELLWTRLEGRFCSELEGFTSRGGAFSAGAAPLGGEERQPSTRPWSHRSPTRPASDTNRPSSVNVPAAASTFADSAAVGVLAVRR